MFKWKGTVIIWQFINTVLRLGFSQQKFLVFAFIWHVNLLGDFFKSVITYPETFFEQILNGKLFISLRKTKIINKQIYFPNNPSKT